MRFYSLLLLSISVLFFSSCSKDEEPPFNTGTTKKGVVIDYTNFSVLGDGITAGYSDNVWYSSAQQYSVGSIFADQLSNLGLNSNYSIPTLNEIGLGIPAEDGKVYRYSKGRWILGEARIGYEEAESIVGLKGEGSNFTNISVIGAGFKDLTDKGYNSKNPYFSYFATSDTSSMVDDVTLADPTFLMLSIGRNDIFEYAKNKGKYPDMELPSSSELQTTVESAIAPLVEGNGGVVIGIDQINDLPYFNFVRNSINLSENVASALNDGIDSLASGVVIRLLDSLRTVTYPTAADTVEQTFLEPLLVNGWDGELGTAIKGLCPRTDPQCDPATEDIAQRIVYNRSYDAAINAGISKPQAVVIATAYTKTGRGQEEIQLLSFAGVKQNWVESYVVNATTALDSLMQTDPLLTLTIQESFITSIEKLFQKLGDRDRVYEVIANQLFDIVLGNVEGDLTSASLEKAINDSISNIVVFAIDALRENGYFPEFVEGDNPFFCIDPDSPTRMRVLSLDDKIMLPYADVLFDLRTFISSIVSGEFPSDVNPEVLLGLFPKVDEVYFYEIQLDVAVAVSDYNLALSHIADDHALVFVNSESVSARLRTGWNVNGKSFSNEYRTGNYYSMDGYGLTPAGNAILVNEALEGVNTRYGSAFQLVDVSTYPTN